MQILFADSDENGLHQGVGIWKTSVRKLHAPILPHMGWNSVEPAKGSTLFQGIEDELFYFVHSYAAQENASGLSTHATHGQKKMVRSPLLSFTQKSQGEQA
jgi:glutamine amidotransferase